MQQRHRPLGVAAKCKPTRHMLCHKHKKVHQNSPKNIRHGTSPPRSRHSAAPPRQRPWQTKTKRQDKEKIKRRGGEEKKTDCRSSAEPANRNGEQSYVWCFESQAVGLDTQPSMSLLKASLLRKPAKALRFHLEAFRNSATISNTERAARLSSRSKGTIWFQIREVAEPKDTAKKNEGFAEAQNKRFTCVA